jgi:hypothetical protein
MAILADLTGVGETFYRLPDALSARRSSYRIGLWVRRAAVSNFWLELSTFTSYRSNRSKISISARVERPFAVQQNRYCVTESERRV